MIAAAVPRGLWSALLAMALIGCAAAPIKSPLADWSPSANHDERRPRFIVLHHTQMRSFESALQVLRTRNARGRVSAHYLIAEDGRIAQLVGEDRRAWHAGAGSWQGVEDINSLSIGIELDNDGEEEFAEAQVAALIRLLEDICTRQRIPRDALLAHAEIAPTRKDDPSVRFPWKRLAEAGFGRWYPEDLPAAPAGFHAAEALARLGYDTRDLPAAVRAFHRRYLSREDVAFDARSLAVLAYLSGY